MRKWSSESSAALVGAPIVAIRDSTLRQAHIVGVGFARLGIDWVWVAPDLVCAVQVHSPGQERGMGYLSILPFQLIRPLLVSWLRSCAESCID